MSRASDADTAGVVAPPPLLYALGLAIALVLHWLVPWPIAMQAWVGWAGALLLAAGIVLGIWGTTTLRTAGTNVDPSKPTTVIVTDGPFRFSRNPLYLSLALDLVGVSMLLNTAWGLVVLLPLLVVMHYGVILREERYLEARFGESYRRYRSTVRRYL